MARGRAHSHSLPHSRLSSQQRAARPVLDLHATTALAPLDPFVQCTGLLSGLGLLLPVSLSGPYSVSIFEYQTTPII